MNLNPNTFICTSPTGKNRSKKKETPLGKLATHTPRKLSSVRVDNVSVLNTSWVGPSPARLSYLPEPEALQRSRSPATPLQGAEIIIQSRKRSSYLVNPPTSERNEFPDTSLQGAEMISQSRKRSSYLVKPPASERNESPDIAVRSAEKRKRMRSSSHQIDGINTLPGRSDSESPIFAMSNDEECEDAIELSGPNEAEESTADVNEAEVNEKSAPKAKNRKKKRARVAMPRKKATDKVKLKICGLEVSAARHQRIRTYNVFLFH